MISSRSHPHFLAPHFDSTLDHGKLLESTGPAGFCWGEDNQNGPEFPRNGGNVCQAPVYEIAFFWCTNHSNFTMVNMVRK